MPVIARFYGIVVKMFYNEHNPPHFHVEYAEFDVIVFIKSLEVSGFLPAKAKKRVLAWTKKYQSELLENWERSMNNEPFIILGDENVTRN